MLEHGVPPVDLGKISIFSSHIAKYRVEGSLDFKFISDRYNRGKSEVEKLMTEKHVLHSCASITMAHAPIVNMQQQMGAVAIDEAIQMCQAISTGNCRTLAFILLPQPYNTGHKALVNKHRRLLEDKVHGFAEWGFASWAMQLERLSAEDPTSTDLDLRFLAVYHSDSAAELSAYENSVKGKMMADWWDKSTVAGPKARPQTSFTEALPTLECLSVVDGEIRSLRYMSVKHVVAI
ncbi:unnamed protein product [Durusdinium trenchii]|uniref:Uncharacterized protein n=1 Tax=Durusdinium trenchii TaxID=1381693 RepID=A0ABP0R6C7_9DINO